MIERVYYRVKFNTDTFVYVAQSNISLPNKIEEFTDDVIYSTDIGATIDTTEKWTLADGSIVENISCKRKIPIIAGEGVIVDADSTAKYIQISIDKDVVAAALNIKNGTGKNSLIQVGCAATGRSAFASGGDTRAIHDFSFVAGLGNRSSSRGQAVFGRYNKDAPNAVFIVGAGHDLAVANGFEVLVDGRATVLTAPVDSIDVVRKLELDTKYDKAGGTIGGNVIITGDLTVNGTQHINNTENLAVKNAMIYSNSDGATLATNGGIGIKKNATDIYGVVYDPTSDSVKLGLGKSDGNGNFTFNAGEGEPVAIRDDSSKFIDCHLIQWNATDKKLVDGGYLPEDFAKLDDVNTFTKTVFSKNAFEGESLRSQWKDADNTIRNRIQIAAKNNDRNFPGSQITIEEIDTTAGSKLVTVYQRGSIKELEFDGVTTWNSGNGNLKTSYEWMFPKKSGTFALLEDVAGSSTTFSVEVWQ